MHATLVHVCPPGTGGVRDYANALRHAWLESGVHSQLIDGTRDELMPRLDALRRATPSGGRLSVVLHFSGYGYAPRGLCGWLADELTQWKSTHSSQTRLVVVFHELFATARAPWQSAFWLAPWQAQVARRIATQADWLWTNTESHAQWLHGVVGDSTPLRVRPVFSNVGEPVDLPTLRLRAPRAIVFGSSATRRRVFAALSGHRPALARLGIQEIVEAGDGASACDQALGVPLRCVGRLSPTELSKLLCGSRFALIDYPARYIGKSGVFASYAASGCAVINTSAQDGEFDGLRRGAHYINLHAPFKEDRGTLALMALRLHRWYGGHALALQAGEMLDVATSAPAEGEPSAMAH